MAISDHEKPVICVEDAELSDNMFVEKGHFYLLTKEGETDVLIDYFNRGFKFVLKTIELKHFKGIFVQQFEEYENYCDEGDTDNIELLVKAILKTA